MLKEKYRGAPTDLNLLITSAARSERVLVPESNWTFYNPEYPRERISALHKAFSELRNRIPQKTATFLDCGSGSGVATLTAYLANYDHAYGIEKNEELSREAMKRLARFDDKKIIPDRAVNFAQGSYYQPDILPEIVDKCAKKLQELYENGGILETTDFVDFVHEVLNVGDKKYPSVRDLIVAYLFTEDNDVYEKLGIINDHKMTADLVYIYPADLFFDCAFLPQMALFMKKGAFLSVLNPVDNPVTVSTFLLRQKQSISLSNCPSDTAMCLQVFQKE